MNLPEDFLLLERTASTQDFLRDHPEYHHRNLFAVAAREQSRGRGQHGREWHMDAGKDIAISVIVRESGDIRPALSLRSAIHCAKALHELLGLTVYLKWPNDLMLKNGGKTGKLGGILAEPAGTAGTTILGIGINVNSEPDQPGAVSVRQICGEQDLDLLRSRLLHHLRESLGGESHRSDTAELCATYEKMMLPGWSVLQSGKSVPVSGITAEGHLKLKNGEVLSSSRDLTWISDQSQAADVGFATQ